MSAHELRRTTSVIEHWILAAVRPCRVFMCVCVPQAVVWQLGKICAVMRAALALHVTRICRNSDVVPSLFSIYVVCSLVA